MNRAELIAQLHADLRQLENGHDPIGAPDGAPGVPMALYVLNFGVTGVMLAMASRGAYHVAVEAVGWATIAIDLIAAGALIFEEWRVSVARVSAVEWRRAMIERDTQPRIVPVHAGNQTGAVELDPEPATFRFDELTARDGTPLVFDAEPLRTILERDDYSFTREDWDIANSTYTHLLTVMRNRRLIESSRGRYRLTAAGVEWARDLLR